MKKMRPICMFLMAIAMVLSVFAVGTFAGNLEPPPTDPPGLGPGPTMHTLEEIYNKVDSIGSIASSAPVEKTGQTECWDESGNSINCVGTEQGGDLQKGVARPDPPRGLRITKTAP